MLKIENFEVMGWEHAIRGMRNPMNSWDKSDTKVCESLDCKLCESYRKSDNYEFCTQPFIVGPNDHTLMMSLAKGGSVHAKYRRMITVYLDVTAPLYWWKEFDTYKVGTVRNSCSTMHKIHSKEFTLDDFSHEHLFDREAAWEDTFDLYTDEVNGVNAACCPTEFLKMTCGVLNFYRQRFLECTERLKNNDFGDWNDGMLCKADQKKYWWQMIQLLPSSYNQRATIMLNYEVLVGIYRDRKNHRLDEWHTFCDWVEELPYSEIIIGERD